MATNLTKVPILRAIQARGYCHIAPVGGFTSYDIKTSALPNGTIIASGENHSSITRVSVMYKAGSRYECGDNIGVTHILRLAAGLSTRNASQFGIMRHIQEVGANLTCSTTRETVAYTLEGTTEAVREVLPYLTEVSSRQVFKPWEVADLMDRAKLELATRPPQQRAIDLLHKAAYRRGLGNSIYISKHQMNKINCETLQHYVATNFLSGRAAVIGIGLNHNELVDFAEGLELESGEGDHEPSPYMGGEIRSDKGGNLAYFAIGAESTSGRNIKDALAFSILKCALGNGPSCKPWGGESAAVLSKAVGQGNHAIAAFNVQYSDSGLFGVLAAAKPKHSARVLEAAIKVLKSGDVSDADVNRGKNQFKRRILSKLENGYKACYYMGEQALIRGDVLSADEMANAIDSVSASDVQNAASSIASKPLSIAAVGNLGELPFLDEIESHSVKSEENECE